MNQLRRGALVVRGLPARVRGRIAWRRAGQLVVERSRSLMPAAQRAISGVGKGLDRGATELGRSAVAGGRGLRSLSRLGAGGLRQFSQLSLRACAQLARLSRVAGLAIGRGARRLGVVTGRLSRRVAGLLWERRAALRALALRGAWWGALALLWLGGRALLDLRVPLAQDALPLFLIGLGLCLPLFFAGAARLRWAGFALGASHAALAVLVWTIATSG
ncbi:hypothetical protein [Nannocystis punicea]|uniref:Uncharacterized protein n=1 Tax=Nannocystis punicea TaxID=2995304 RepID=A0ABY7GYS4_9BACT|nr:hypothetical protein [Nannocystis poenicansa]WAS92141.1 hypothetical protein O0S08_38660 [Nannocystis poenicansa]